MKARIASVLAASAVAAAGMTAAAAPAATAGVLGGECGAGYSLVGLHKVGNQHTDKIDLHMEVYYSASAKRNCLISRHAGDAYGEVRETHARIRPSGAAWPSCNSTGCDYGNYAYYAGPVYTPAGVDMSHRCVDIAGYAGIQVDKILYNQHCG
ncbi:MULTISPECIES: hypothetical protein [unclassified Amycolatopsis]|uniref:hypothetical protein n=1 Tax=unclassified Amycolatopsis TaxID=2618356 RepID=UPI002E20E741|nr:MULTISPECIES: hypothetical protein [unclassified Amycolatopsis]